MVERLNASGGAVIVAITPERQLVLVNSTAYRLAGASWSFLLGCG